MRQNAAIAWTLAEAHPGDCVLIAGKGHETEQIIGTQRFPFDDREVVRAAWRDVGSPALRRSGVAPTA